MDINDLARNRMHECQGTLIGGMVVAKELGLSPREYGFRMMALQNINWEKLSDSPVKIARVFSVHYLITYDIKTDMQVHHESNVDMHVPYLSNSAAGQLKHWNANPDDLAEVDKGFWDAVSHNTNLLITMANIENYNRITIMIK